MGEKKDWIPDIPIPPRLESQQHPDAVGSYGAGFVEWCKEHWPDQPLPWQAYVMARALEHDEDGALVYRRIGISVPRQVGKSVLLRQLAAWRINSEQLFGEAQTVLHVAHSLNTTEEVFWPAIETAKARGWQVREANGQMRIQVGANRWVPRSTQTGYGFTLSLALVDEAWAVQQRRVDSTYGPTLSARVSGQVVMFSSANEEATLLFPRFRETALKRPGWLLLEWSAPADADPYDRAVWQAATPVPVESARAGLMADELASDEHTFKHERLNIWPTAVGLSWGQRVSKLLAAQSPAEFGGLLVGALESDRGGMWGAAVSDGTHIEAAELPSRLAAMEWLTRRGAVRLLAVEAVIRQMPDGALWQKVVQVDERAAVATFEEHAASLSWSGAMAEQLRRAVLTSSAAIDGRRSDGPVGAVKAATWAFWAAQSQQTEMPAIY
jgi:hypothetical protein